MEQAALKALEMIEKASPEVMEAARQAVVGEMVSSAIGVVASSVALVVACLLGIRAPRLLDDIDTEGLGTASVVACVALLIPGFIGALRCTSSLIYCIFSPDYVALQKVSQLLGL